jgi:hypothetical protein
MKKVRRRSKRVSQRLTASDPSAVLSPLFYRRCHICGAITEKSGSSVQRCGSCGKNLAPFYFFDEMSVVPLSDHESTPGWRVGDRRPLRGFTAIW